MYDQPHVLPNSSMKNLMREIFEKRISKFVFFFCELIIFFLENENCDCDDRKNVCTLSDNIMSVDMFI